MAGRSLISSHWRRLTLIVISGILLALLSANFMVISVAAHAASASSNNRAPAGTLPLAPGIWDAQNYRIPHHVASCPQPPANISARLALQDSLTLLDYYGLITPAMVKGDSARWRDLVSHMSTRVCDSSTPIMHGKLVVNITFYPNSIWGGYGSQCSYCPSYYAADAQFTVPSIYQSYWTTTSTWVGTGGSASYTNALSQTGVSEDSLSWANQYWAFYETVQAAGWPGGEEDTFQVSAGDLMYAYTNTNGHDVINDYTKGYYTAVNWGYSSNESAEFIQEKNSSHPLSNFGSITFHHAEFESADGYWHNVDADGTWLWQAVNSNYNQYMGYNGVYNDSGYGSTFTYNWLRGS